MTPTQNPSDQLTASSDSALTILLVEDEGIVAQYLEDVIVHFGYRVVGVASEGVQAVCMAQELEPQLIVMDVGLRGDIDGIQAAQMIQERSHVPVIFLTAHRDEQTLKRAVSTGPLGYLVKPFQEVELRCAIEVAVHKHRAEVAMREREEALRRNSELLTSLSLVDELTQLKNRRGFFELAGQALKVARRERYTLGLFFVDLDGLKQINDTLGHLSGDQALRDTAAVLRRTFRESDIIARFGGDEFVALAHVSRDSHALRDRLREHLKVLNAQSNRPYRIEVSVGTALVDGTADESIETLIARADAAMYEEKRRP
ncbi:MAG TPA: diguanylate cyclase [Steroidobacteraceae bacterium]|jgi:diguanylate cyclase (GGDEF)-like protein